MMRDVIERFRYRFELWHRERREDLFGVPRSDPRTFREYSAQQTTSRWNDPKYEVILTEPTWSSIGRGVGVYFGITIIAAQICWILAGFFPTARYPLAIVFVVFVCLWTLAVIIGAFD